jgi:hypothetical protein
MLNDFIAQVRNRGIARVNRYRVIIPRIPFTTGISDTDRLLSLFCESVTLPGVNINTTEHRMFGEFRRFPYERTYDDVMMNFYLDADFDLKLIFDHWIGKIINPDRRTIQYYKSYITDIILEILPVDETKPVYTLTLYEAYPKTMQSINLNSRNNEPATLSVTFECKYWKANELYGNKSRLGKRPGDPGYVEVADRSQFPPVGVNN